MFGHKLTQKCLALVRGTQQNKPWSWKLHAPETSLFDSNPVGSRTDVATLILGDTQI